MRSMHQWQFLWLNVVATAWGKEQFRKDLQDKDARAVIEKELKIKPDEFPLPPWVHLKVHEAKDDKWLPVRRFWPLPPTKLTWRVPKKPSDGDLPLKFVTFAKLIAQFEGTADNTEGARSIAIESASDEARESALPAFDQAEGWLTVWPHAIALTWRDGDFAKLLKKDPSLTLLNAFSFQVPAAVELEVELPREEASWPTIPPLTGQKPLVDLEMILPHPPPQEDGAIALGAYYESGRSNPFTLIFC